MSHGARQQQGGARTFLSAASWRARVVLGVYTTLEQAGVAADKNVRAPAYQEIFANRPEASPANTLLGPSNAFVNSDYAKHFCNGRRCLVGRHLVAGGCLFSLADNRGKAAQSPHERPTPAPRVEPSIAYPPIPSPKRGVLNRNTSSTLLDAQARSL